MTCPHMLVAVAGLDLAHVFFHEVSHHLPFGQEERDAGPRIGRESEQFEILADLAVVPGSCLFQAPEVSPELLLRRPDRTVDTGEQRFFLVPPPVRPGYVLQLEGAEPPSARDVRAAAQIEKISLLVDRDLTVFQPLDDLRLVRVIHVEILGVGLGDLFPLYREVPRDDLMHPLLDARQILVREATRYLDIVVKAVLYRRGEGPLATRIELHYGLGHSVSRRMPQHLEALGGVCGNYLEGSTTVQLGIEVYELPVQFRDYGVSGEAFTDLRGDIPGFLARLYLQLFTVG